MILKNYFLLLLTLFTGSLIFSETIEISPETSTLLAAVEQATEGDTIILLPGIYKGKGNRNIELGEKSLIITSKEGPDKTIIDCFVKDETVNRAFIFSNSEKQLSISGLTITKASASSLKKAAEKAEPLLGGALYIDHANPVIENCVFTQCSSEIGGSVAMILNNSQPQFIACEFRSNQGDLIYIMQNSRALLSNCLFEENRALQGDASGCIYVDGLAKDFSLGHLQANNCVFRNNKGFSAGAILNSGESLFYNCLFVNNSAETNKNSFFPSGVGGAISNYGHIALNNCTFYGNRAALSGGAVYIEHNPVFSNLRNNSYIRNSILWANQAETSSSAQLGQKETTAILQYSCIQDFTGTGKEMISKTPLFNKPSAGDFGLQLYSNCINAGDPSFSEEEIDVDLAGNHRIQNNRVDIGAFEHNVKVSYLELLSRELVFDVIFGTQKKLQKQAYFRNLTPQLLFWKARSTAEWISLNPQEGQAEGVYSPIKIQVNTTGMKPGVYESKIILGFEGSEMTQEIAVKLNLHGSKIQLSKNIIHVNLDKRYYNTENPLHEYFTISNSGYLPLNYSLNSDSPILQLSPKNGTITTKAEEIRVSIDPKKLSLGENHFVIEVLDYFAINNPVKLPVTIFVLDTTPKVSEKQ